MNAAPAAGPDDAHTCRLVHQRGLPFRLSQDGGGDVRAVGHMEDDNDAGGGGKPIR